MKRDSKIYIYAYTDEQRVLCLDLGARISSHYFQYVWVHSEFVPHVHAQVGELDSV